MAVPTGFEPAIFCVTGRRDGPLHYGTTNNWLRELDLNQRPSGYEPDELPDCSIPRCNVTIKVAEEKGFEPLRRLRGLPVFKTGPFNQTWVFLQKPFLFCQQMHYNIIQIKMSINFLLFLNST